MAHRSLCLDSEEEHGSRKKTGQVGSRRWALEVTNEAPSKPQGGGEILYMSPLLLATSPCMWVLERSPFALWPGLQPLTHLTGCQPLVFIGPVQFKPQKVTTYPTPTHGRVLLFSHFSEEAAEAQKYNIPCPRPPEDK